MSDSALNGVMDPLATRETYGQAARTAALLSLLGMDCKKNIETIVTRSLDIFQADLALYLSTDGQAPPAAAGVDLSAPLLSRLLPWTKQILARPTKGGVVLLGEDRLPGGLQTGCCLMACIPVAPDGHPLGMLAVGFETPREFNPDDFHAAGCLAGALGLQHRLAGNEQKIKTGMIARKVAHDLNNILAGLVSYPELILMQMDDDNPLKGPVALMHDTGLRAAEMVQDFLILARPPDRLNLHPISPSASARAFCQTGAYAGLRSAFPQARFSFFIDPDLPDINGTDQFLPKVFTTLLHHAALNLAGPGQVTVTLKEPSSSKDRHPESGGILLIVEDNGPRIKEKDLVHLLTPFYTSQTMGRQGSGLGLSAVHKLVRDHDGTIRVSSGSTRGTRFEIFLPAISG